MGSGEQAVVAERPNWLFLDNIDNADWVSYSAILDFKKQKLDLMIGQFEEKIL